MEHVKINRIIRSKRKTIALVVSSDETLTVRAPMCSQLDYIEKLVSKKSFWIRRKINEIQSRPKAKPKEFVNGEGFLYLGKTYRLKIVDSNEISLGENLYFSRNMLPSASDYLKEWYKTQATQKIQERADWHAKKMGVGYKSINITDAQRRWGSCTPKGNLCFSWRLIMAPLEVLDYVVVHELVHLRERNHAASFWSKVKLLLPNYTKHMDWLKENEYMLRI